MAHDNLVLGLLSVTIMVISQFQITPAQQLAAHFTAPASFAIKRESSATCTLEGVSTANTFIYNVIFYMRSSATANKPVPIGYYAGAAGILLIL